MLDFAEKAYSQTKKFVEDHKMEIAIAATALVTATVMTVVFVKAKNETIDFIDDFLAEKGLLDEFAHRIIKSQL